MLRYLTFSNFDFNQMCFLCLQLLEMGKDYSFELFIRFHILQLGAFWQWRRHLRNVRGLKLGSFPFLYTCTHVHTCKAKQVTMLFTWKKKEIGQIFMNNDLDKLWHVDYFKNEYFFFSFSRKLVSNLINYRFMPIVFRNQLVLDFLKSIWSSFS